MNKKTVWTVVIIILIIVIIWQWPAISAWFQSMGSSAERQTTACFRKCFNSYTNAGYTNNEATGICNGWCSGGTA